MSLGVCLPDLIEQGLVPERQAEEARALYDELVAEHARTGSREAAEALASSAVLDALQRQVDRKAFLAGKTIAVRNRVLADIQGFDPAARNGGSGGGSGAGGGGKGGPIDPAAGPALIGRDPRARFSNVEGRRKAVLAQAHRLMDGILAKHSADLLGRVRRKAELDEIVRELFNQGTDSPAAKQLADAWRQTAEMLRKRFNAAGGEIGYRADWGLPQTHDWKKVRAEGFEAWRAFVIDKLDPARMIDQRTGQPMTREALENALPEIYDTIRSQGWSKRTPGGTAQGKALANSRSDARFLVFRDADAWMEYAGRFGSGTPYDAMVGHMEAMARDIAALEVLGPNPAATLEFVKQTMVKSAAVDRSPGSDGVQAAENAGKKIDDLWDEYRGANLEPRNEQLALWFSGLRAFQVSTKLGGAMLSATSDFAFQASRRAFNGLHQRTVMRDYLKLMRPGSIEDQKLAVRRGLIAEEWANRTAAQSRYLMEELTGEVQRRLADAVLRVSLLSRHTQSMRWVYGMEVLSTFTEAAGKAYDALDPKLRGQLGRYGIDAKGWDAIRAAPMDVDRGVEWISPHRFEDRELANRFLEMIHEETDIAVPVADLQTRAVFNNALERGTWLGEIGRSLVQFKSFGVSVMLRQWAEIAAMQPGTAARYAGGLVIGTTLMGALAMQLKAVAAGKDPRPMEDDKFWYAAMLQGGGFGIFGDFLHATENRAGRGLLDTLAGPTAGDVQELINLAKDDHPERRLVKTLKGFIPGNNLWYTRAAFDRMLADQIHEAIDPDYRRAQQRLERYAAEQGTDFFWEPGDPLPERAPDFSNALAEGPADEE